MSEVSAPPPPPAPPAPAPPPPPPVSKSAAPGRSALLGSIEGFSANKLKKVKTNEKKNDTRPTPASNGGSSGGGSSGGSSKPAGGNGPSGFGDIFSGGMPKLRSTKGTTTTETSSNAVPTPKPVQTPIVKPSAPIVKPSAPVVKPSAPVVKPSAPAVNSNNTATTPKPTVTSISKPVVKQSTGVLRPAPVISKAPIVGKVAAKPSAPAGNTPSAPVTQPSAVPTPKPTPPVIDPSTTVVAPSPTKSSPKPTYDLPPPISKPNHDSISAPIPTPAKEEPKPAQQPSSSEGGVVSEHTILPGDGSKHVQTTSAAPKVTPPPTTTTTPTSKPAAGGTQVNWVKPGSGPISPIGKVVQSASVQVAPPRKTVVSTATPTMKPAPLVGAKKPAAVNTTSTTPPSTTPTNISNPTTPTSTASPKQPAVFNIPPPIVKPNHQESGTPTPAPTPAAPPKEEPKPVQQQQQPHKEQESHTHTESSHTHTQAPPLSHQNSSNSLSGKNTSPRKIDNDGELSCARCGGGIEGNHFKALDQAWHIEHFTCVECNTGIQNFVSHEGQPFCEVCYDRKFVVHKVCNVCDKPIFGTVVSAMNNTFHSECFKCSNCHSTFPDNEFYQYESKPWCASCIQNITKAKYEKCDHCHKEIDSKSDGVIKVLGSKYHNNGSCFVCRGCSTVFPNLNYYEINNTPMCYDCAIKH